ncbi:type IV pilin protein [Sedimenticola hydrogenitrophicus]|uniref:type IV pilin protein n=1 Tax=Sedimenticola hydrogenitrophicus TaxID=2967975 RepID=UPI0021A84D03|nr:type IV pilin protein [Sedimenticola hydrogenitrophicus]
MEYIHNRGFTLIELMIVVAVIGILAAIAYPSYEEQVRKSRRADATGALLGLAGALERRYTSTGSYAGAGAGGGNTGAPTIFSTTSPVDGGTAAYNLTINTSNASTFTIHAAPTGPQAGDKCGTLTLTQDGTRNVTGQSAGITANDCWN